MALSGSLYGSTGRSNRDVEKMVLTELVPRFACLGIAFLVEAWPNSR